MTFFNRRTAHFSLGLSLILLSLPVGSADAAKRVFSGEHEYGVKYTDDYAAPDETPVDQDDDAFDRFTFRNSWLQYEHPLNDRIRVSLRGQRLERDYTDRPTLDNVTDYGQVRVTFEPAEGWAIWPHVSLRLRDYEKNSLDNEILLAGVESRYRWGVRHNIRFGASYTTTDYEQDPTRERSSGAAFASYERPVTEGLTLRVGARVEQTDFAVVAASRRDATKGSASIGFRYEF